MNHCSCNQGRHECECEVPQDLPLTGTNLAIAAAIIALAAFVASIWPLGFAS